MTDWWDGQSYGYDQVGTTDPYYDIERTRYSTSPSAIKNINTPVHDHIYKRPYEEMRINNQCQELLMDMRDNKNELKQLKSELKTVGKQQGQNNIVESFLGGLGIKDDNIFIYILIFVGVIFIVLQMQIQQTNEFVKMMITCLNEKGVALPSSPAIK